MSENTIVSTCQKDGEPARSGCRARRSTSRSRPRSTRGSYPQRPRPDPLPGSRVDLYNIRVSKASSNNKLWVISLSFDPYSTLDLIKQIRVLPEK